MSSIFDLFKVCCCFPFGLQCIILVLSLLFVFMASSASFHHLLQRYPPTLLCQDSSLPTFIGSWANLLKIHHTTPLHSCPLIHDFVKQKFLCLPFNALLNLMPTKISHFPLLFFYSLFVNGGNNIHYLLGIYLSRFICCRFDNGCECFVSKIASTNVVVCNNVLVTILDVMVCCYF